jgi:hypothetical protein
MGEHGWGFPRELFSSHHDDEKWFFGRHLQQPQPLLLRYRRDTTRGKDTFKNDAPYSSETNNRKIHNDLDVIIMSGTSIRKAKNKSIFVGDNSDDKNIKSDKKHSLFGFGLVRKSKTLVTCDWACFLPSVGVWILNDRHASSPSGPGGRLHRSCRVPFTASKAIADTTSMVGNLCTCQCRCSLHVGSGQMGSSTLGR